jgi:hypothetical protein
MAAESFFLYQKVKLIFEILCRRNMQEVAYFLSSLRKVAKNPDYRKNRVKSLERSLNREAVGVADLKRDFDQMPIASLQMEGVPLFSSAFFFDSSVAEFRRRLQEYVEFTALKTIGLKQGYTHLYLFDSRSEGPKSRIEHYSLSYDTFTTMECGEGIGVTCTPSGDLQPYRGCVRSDDSRILFTLSGSHDTLAMLFNQAMVAGAQEPLFDEVLYGAAIGIEDQSKSVVVAKKVALMKSEPDEASLRRLYLILNETQMFDVRENLYAMQNGNIKLDTDYLSRYRQKILDFDHFFSAIKKGETVPAKVTDHMVFAEYHAFSKLFDKYARNQDFFLSSRRRVMLTFLEYIRQYRHKEVKMVLPLYEKEENIFLYRSIGRTTLFDEMLILAKDGVKFDIVFVIEKPQDYHNAYMEGVFAQLDEAGADMGFVDIRETEGMTPGSDFLFVPGSDFAIIRDLPGHEGALAVVRKEELARSCENSFIRLMEQAHSYSEIVEGNCALGVHDDVVKKLLGRWYGYFFGSIKDEQGERILWEVIFDVESDSTISERRKETSTEAYGRIDTGLHQTQFIMQDSVTQNSHYLIFDNKDVMDLFSVLLISKQFRSDKDMLSTGILSRSVLDIEELSMLLPDHAAMSISARSLLQKRIKDYLDASSVSSLIQSR